MSAVNPSFFPQVRYLITQIGQQQLAFPLQWVSELILVEQSHILPLPFYDPMVLGVLHYRGDVVPLVIAPLANKVETATAIQRLRIKRTLTAVRLNQAVGKLAGVGLIVDRVNERIVSHAVFEHPPDAVIERTSELSAMSSSNSSPVTGQSSVQFTIPAEFTPPNKFSPQVRVFQLEDIPPGIWQPR